MEENKQTQTNSQEGVERESVFGANQSSTQTSPLNADSDPMFANTNTVREEKVALQNSHKQLYVLFGFLFVVGFAIALFVLIQSRLNRFENFSFDSSEFVIEDTETVNQEQETEVTSEQSNDTDIGFVDCSSPFVQVEFPVGGETFMYGQDVVFDWSMCGISQSLFDDATISYFDVETLEKKGEFDLSCTNAVFDFENTNISWNVPELISSKNYTCPLLSVIDFTDGFVFDFGISYASGQYVSFVSESFFLDVTNFVFEPPVFSQYPIQTSDFSRALLLDSSVPTVFQERISPSFFQAPTNFANFYRTFQLSCGQNCVSENVLVDFRTGAIVIAPQALSIITTSASSLFVAEDTSYEDLQERDALVSWYEFIEQTKQFSLLEQKLCNISGLPTNREYADCIEP